MYMCACTGTQKFSDVLKFLPLYESSSCSGSYTIIHEDTGFLRVFFGTLYDGTHYSTNLVSLSSRCDTLVRL